MLNCHHLKKRSDFSSASLLLILEKNGHLPQLLKRSQNIGPTSIRRGQFACTNITWCKLVYTQ